jgi:hypothetical protein
MWGCAPRYDRSKEYIGRVCHLLKLPELALLAISLRSGDRPQLGVELPSPHRHLGVESDPQQANSIVATTPECGPNERTFAEPARHAELGTEQKAATKLIEGLAAAMRV